MKKIKFIVTSLALVACIGGALAFKAQQGYNVTYYTGTSATSCPNQVLGKEDPNAPLRFYTTDPAKTTECGQLNIKIPE